MLNRQGVHNVRQLLGTDWLRFRYLKGVSDKTRREILDRSRALKRLRPDLTPAPSTVDGAVRASIDRLAEQLVARRPAGEERPEDRILARYLAMEHQGPGDWPTAGEVARSAAVPRSAVADALEAARDRWNKSADLNALRTDVLALIADLGGVASASELAERLLAARGSVKDDGPGRWLRARAVLRAAVEQEKAKAEPRFNAYGEGGPVLIATAPENAAYAQALGRIADGLAAQDPLPGPARVEDELSRAPMPVGAQALPAGRRLRLAVAASSRAALSASQEVYPRGMGARAALRLSLGALTGPEVLEEKDIQDRVRARFPDARALPSRPELDALLEELNADRVWRDAPGGRAGFYAKTVSDSDSGAPAGQRLATSAPAAEAEILRRFPRAVISLERLMLRAMRQQAEARRVLWPRAVAADGAARDSVDFRNLLKLAARAAPAVRDEGLALREPALLTRPGLLARYDLMEVLETVAQASGAAGGPPSLWLLAPQSASGPPRIDDRILPVLSGSNWARLTDSWVLNQHRAGGKAA